MLTLFTEPSLNVFFVFKKRVKNFLKLILLKKVQIYSGHYAVVRSLQEGLKLNGINFNYNPDKINQIGEHVHVLAGVNTLKMAIMLKKKMLLKN